jgi:hypothetical protein
MDNFENIRNNILNSVKELRDKKTGNNIPIIKRNLQFETSKYSSTKTNLWHVFFNDNKLKKSTDYVITYSCLFCNELNHCSSTQFLRKIRQYKPQCFHCNTINLNLQTFLPKEKVIKEELTFIEKRKKSIMEYELYPDTFKNSYELSHLSENDYQRIKSKIVSIGNGKHTDINDYEFWTIYKVNNQMRFSSFLYDPIKNFIFKANQPIMKCDNCTKEWRCKSLESFKNCYKILCNDCKLCNRTFKIRPIKNINNDIIIYQSKLELKFVRWCESNKLTVKNGPTVEYTFNGKTKKYRVDFQIGNILIELKDFHIWHRNQVDSGQWDAKVNEANKYIKDNNLDKYYFITPNNWNQTTTELLIRLNKI